jgi:phosphoserine phosphatase
MSRETRKIKRALERLGRMRNADEIAQYLKERGIKGHTISAYDCPIARYVEAETGVAVAVAQRSVSPRGDYMEWVMPPPNVSAFIAQFDLHQYSDLVEVAL